VTLKSGSGVTQGHQNCYHFIVRLWFPISMTSIFPVGLKIEIHEIHEIHQNLRNPVSINLY